MNPFVLDNAIDQNQLLHQQEKQCNALDFVCIQRVLVTFALILKLVAKQRLLGSHGVESNLIIVLVAVLPQTVEAIFLIIRLGCAHAPDYKRCHHECCHGGRCKEGQEILIVSATYWFQPTSTDCLIYYTH